MIDVLDAHGLAEDALDEGYLRYPILDWSVRNWRDYGNVDFYGCRRAFVESEQRTDFMLLPQSVGEAGPLSSVFSSILCDLLSRHYLAPDQVILPADVQDLLGPKGIRVITRVLALTRNAALNNDWPLNAIDMRIELDPEIENQEYVLILLQLNTSYDVANRVLEEFYLSLQEFADGLTGVSRQIFMDKIYFDVEAV